MCRHTKQFDGVDALFLLLDLRQSILSFWIDIPSLYVSSPESKSYVKISIYGLTPFLSLSLFLLPSRIHVYNKSQFYTSYAGSVLDEN